GRVVRVPFHLRNRSGTLHARLADEEVDGLVEAHLAPVQIDVDDDAASPPDLVRHLHELRLRVGAEAGFLHHVLAVVGPSFDRFHGIAEDARVRRIQAGARELEVVAWVSLVDGRVPRPRVRMLAEHLGLVLDRSHHVETLFAGLEAVWGVVRREWNDMSKVRRRLDHIELFIRWERSQVMLCDESFRICHRLRGVFEGPVEPRWMIRLDDLVRLVDRCAGLDLIRQPGEGSLALAEILLADRIDLVHGQPEFSESDELPELRGTDAEGDLRPREDVLFDPPGMASEGFLRFRDRLLEAGPFGTGEGLPPRGFDDMQETGQSFDRLKCYLGPHPHRRSDPVFRLLNVGGGPFEASHD